MIKSVIITFNSGRTLHWDLDLAEQGTLRMNESEVSSSLSWVRLEFCKCPACTLDEDTNPLCPVAALLARYTLDLADRTSYERVDVHVIEADGHQMTLRRVPLQNVVSELVRLAAFQSECPVGRRMTAAMSPLDAFPSNAEVLQALARHFASTSIGGQCRLAPSQKAFLESVREMFDCLSRRLEKAGKGDVHLNALVIMHSLSTLFSLSASELIQEVSSSRLPLTQALPA